MLRYRLCQYQRFHPKLIRRLQWHHLRLAFSSYPHKSGENRSFAGRLVSIYPNRFAAIVYDRAIFDGEARAFGTSSESTNVWIQAINPSRKILDNPNIKIYVLHDGSRIEGHGELQLSRQFLNGAKKIRPDIKDTLGQQKIGIGLWNLIFEFLTNCKNMHPDHVKVDIPSRSGYAGPISEVFATPFIVVEGTHTNEKEAGFMDNAINNLKAQYQEQFYGAELTLKKDIDVTDEDIGKYSLVLVGNAASNTVWGRLAAKYPDDLTPYNPPDDWASSSGRDAFAEVFKNPVNKNNYLLLFGSNELGNMPLLRDFSPYRAY